MCNKTNKKIICIIQARMDSTRLPGKILLDLEGKPVLLRVIDRALKSKNIDQIIVATTLKKSDDEIVNLIKNYHPKVDIFRGSEDDVLDRYYRAAKKFKADIVVRITSDCPLTDSAIIDKVIGVFLSAKGKVDYVANGFKKRTYPRGLAIEAFSFGALEKIWEKAESKEDKEHVTLYLKKNTKIFKYKNVLNNKDYSFHRWAIDEPDDYKLIKFIYKELFHKNENFSMEDVIKLFEKNPELVKVNWHVKAKLARLSG